MREHYIIDVKMMVKLKELTANASKASSFFLSLGGTFCSDIYVRKHNDKPDTLLKEPNAYEVQDTNNSHSILRNTL